ncbi:MAG TPA: SCO family protein [Stellaceae bacterium]|nr:SCO family protein [Stellaceae bacterium]
MAKATSSPGCERRAAPAFARRRFLGVAAAGAALLPLAGCGGDAKWHSIDVSGTLPPLDFTMTRAGDGKPVTQADYRGKVVLLYFGYTNCPDICPTVLAHVSTILDRLGPDAQRLRMLFVTVDPNRDTPTVLAKYVKNFGAEIDGLRGTPDELAMLARRYRAAYSVTPAVNGHPYEVTHSSAIYVFDAAGAARLIIASLSSQKPDIAGTTADLRRLVEATRPRGLWSRFFASL